MRLRLQRYRPRSRANRRAKFNDPKFVKESAVARKKNKADAMFCWK